MDETGMPIERKKSYGIGGAGNIRRPSDFVFPTKSTDNNGGENEDRRPSLSSLWSAITPSPSSSPSEKRASLLNLFRRGSKDKTEGQDGGNVQEPQQPQEQGGATTKIKFKKVDLGGAENGSE